MYSSPDVYCKNTCILKLPAAGRVLLVFAVSTSRNTLSGIYSHLLSGGIGSLFAKLDSLLLRSTKVLGTVLLWSLACLLFVQVVLRYLFQYSLMWIEEISLLMLTWVVFMGVTIGFIQKQHMSLDIITKDLLKNTHMVGKFLSVFIECVVLLTLVILFIQGAIVTKVQWAIITNTLHFPVSLYVLAIPVSALLVLLSKVFRFLGGVKGDDREGGESDE